MKKWIQYPLLVVIICLISFSLALRLSLFNARNLDILIFEKWYDYVYINGWSALASESFSNYPPAYLYLLWLSTLIGDFIGRIPALKLFPTLFDVFSMYIIFRMARLYYPQGYLPYLFSAIFFSLPTVILNSSGWGQVDSYYTAFLLLSVYLLLDNKPIWAVIAFGIAFSFKSQAVFLLPFLGIMVVKGKIHWYYLLFIPIVYSILALPIILTGRSWVSIVTIYVEQVSQFHKLALNAPNLYIFIPDQYYAPGLRMSLAIFTIVMGVWGWMNWKAKNIITNSSLLFAALTSLVLVVFTLPLMHERYFYPVDVFSFAIVIFNPELWLLPILFQISSGLSYTVFLLGKPIELVMVGAIINTFLVVYIIKKQISILYEANMADKSQFENGQALILRNSSDEE